MFVLYNEESGIKRVVSSNYNYHFNTKTGEFIRWGKTLEDDPVSGPVEICDMEISEACSGIPAIGSDVAVPCSFCYKTNTKVGREMSFDTFKKVFDNISGGVVSVTIATDAGESSFHPDEEVILVDGTTKKAKDITYFDEIQI